MRTLRDLPGPKGLPILGNLLELDLKRLHRQLEDWAKAHGETYVFELGRKPIVVFTEPEHIQSILRNRLKVYRRLSSIEPVFNEMGINGLFSAEGENWKRQRRLSSHAFDVKHLQQFFPTLLKVTGRLRNRWLRAARAGDAIDPQHDFMRYTVDVTTNLAFGYDMNTLETEGDVIQEHLEKIFPALNTRINAPFPWWRYFKLPQDRALDRALSAIGESIDRFIAQARARIDQDPKLAEHPTNFLEAMLTARNEGDAAFSDEEIRGNALTILLAGEDTTANTLAWMTHYMCEFPAVHDEMRREAEAVVDATEMLPTLEAGDRLPYLEAVTHETMRLKPVAPVLFLEALEDAQVGDISIPKGTAIMTLNLHGALSEANFHEAPRFNPNRWLTPPAAPGAEKRPHNARAFTPFGGGPRVCPGRHLAMIEIKTAMSMIAATFQVSSVPGATPPTELFSFSMMPQGLRISVSQRQSAPASAPRVH